MRLDRRKEDIMRKTIKRILAALLLITMLGTSAMATSYKATVIKAAMKVYNKNKKYVGTLGRGKRITVTGFNGKWIRFKYKKTTAYAHLRDVMFDKRIKAVTTKDVSFSFVTKKSWKQSKYYKGTLIAGSTVYICGKKGTKYLVTNDKKSAYGYISRSAVQKV